LIIPTAAFGSCWVFKTLFNSRSVFRLLGLIAVAVLYVIGLLVSIGMALSHMDKAHIELGLSYSAMAAVLATFFFWDGVRIYREIHRR
jgi:type III secretory pathway component EscS